MAGGYTKLFSSILDSTVWQTPADTRLTWITMLAMADQNGVVSSSIPGLARRAGVSLEACEQALATFLAPDTYSRTKDHDGRRIEPVHGGWVLLNHAHYRQLREADERREQARIGMQNLRERRKAEAEALTVNGDANLLPKVSQAEASASAGESKTLPGKPGRVRSPPKADPLTRFPEFWALYPNKQGKAEAMKRWARDGLDAQADTILADVRARMKSSEDWKRGAIPHGSTYVHQQRWIDAVVMDAPAAPVPGAAFGASPVVKRTAAEEAEEHRRNNEIVARMAREMSGAP